MKAVVRKGLGNIGLEDVPEPEIKDPYDVIVRITASAICGTDLHFVRGTMPRRRDAFSPTRRSAWWRRWGPGCATCAPRGVPPLRPAGGGLDRGGHRRLGQRNGRSGPRRSGGHRRGHHRRIAGTHGGRGDTGSGEVRTESCPPPWSRAPQ
jgi:hypothetical protein